MAASYSVLLEAVSISAARTLCQVNAPATGTLRLVRAEISQTTSTTSELLRARISRRTTAGTGSAYTAKPFETLAAAFAGTTTVNHTAEGTLGDVLIHEAFDKALGWLWVPQRDLEEIWVPPSGRVALDLPAAPAGATTFNAELVFQLIG